MTRKKTPPNPWPDQPGRTIRQHRLLTAETSGPVTEPRNPVEVPVPAEAASAQISKIDAVVAMLRRPEGASVDEIMVNTGWQRHSVRGALAGAVKNKLDTVITSEVTDGVRCYRTPEAAA